MANIIKFIKKIREAKRAEAQLTTMTDRQLADIGITRGDIKNVVKGKYKRYVCV